MQLASGHQQQFPPGRLERFERSHHRRLDDTVMSQSAVVICCQRHKEQAELRIQFVNVATQSCSARFPHRAGTQKLELNPTFARFVAADMGPQTQ